MKFDHKLSQLAIAITLAGFSANTLAQESDEVVQVYGTAVNGVIQIDEEHLSQIQAQDLNDIFRSTSDVTVGGSDGITQKIYIRGLEDGMLNISIDGANQAGTLFHHQGRIFVEPELIKSVEVQPGAGRATQGPGALGGSVEFETKDAFDLLEGDKEFGALVKNSYQTNNNGFRTSATAFGLLDDSFGILTSIGKTKTDNLTSGNDVEQQETATDNSNGLVKLSAQLTDSNLVSVSAEQRKDYGENLNKPNFVSGDSNPSLNQETLRQTFTLNHELSVSDAFSADSTLYYNIQDLKHKNNPRWNVSTTATVETVGGNLTLTNKRDSFKLDYGLDFRLDNSKLLSVESASSFEEDASVYGLFTQVDWQVLDSVFVSVGGRYDSYTLNTKANLDKTEIEFDANGFSPNALLQLKPIDGLTVYASYAQALRGQKIMETFLLDHAVHDKARKEEKATNIEFGVEYYNSGFISELVAFSNKIDDVVLQERIGGKKTYANRDEYKNSGFSAKFGYQDEVLSVLLGYTNSTPELDDKPLNDGNFELGTSTGNKWTFDVNYLLGETLTLAWHSTFVEKLELASADSFFPTKPSYNIHDASVRWIPEDHQNVSLGFAVKNIFDEHYRDHATYSSYKGYETVAQGFDNPGRDFRFDVNYQF